MGRLPSSEEFYFGATSDSQNRSLTCVKGDYYTIDFILPIPANAFWSLTLYSYNNNEALVSNAIDRYSIDDQVRGITGQLTVGPMCFAKANALVSHITVCLMLHALRHVSKGCQLSLAPSCRALDIIMHDIAFSHLNLNADVRAGAQWQQQ